MKRRRAALGPGRLVATARPERRPGVVRHLARPHEIPERRERVRRVEPGRRHEVEPEERAVRERCAKRDVRLAFGGSLGSRLTEHARVLAEVDGDPVEPGTGPDHLAGGAERVEVGRPVGRDAPRQHLRLPERHGQRQRLEWDERLAQRLPAADPVPRGEEATERSLLGRLDLATKRRERRAPDAAQDIRVAPLALGAPGPQLAADEPLVRLETLELLLRRAPARGRTAPQPPRS